MRNSSSIPISAVVPDEKNPFVIDTWIERASLGCGTKNNKLIHHNISQPTQCKVGIEQSFAARISARCGIAH
jgi:hypothetical protein